MNMKNQPKKGFKHYSSIPVSMEVKKKLTLMKIQLDHKSWDSFFKSLLLDGNGK